MNKAQITAALLIVAGAIWLGSGYLSRSMGPEPPAATGAMRTESDVVPTVRVMRSEAKPYAGGVVLQGRTAASRTVDLRAEVTGKIEKVLKDRGQQVSAGTEVYHIAVNDRAAKLEQARASLTQRQMQAEAARQLAKESFQSKVKLAEAEAQYEQAKADVARIELDLANTKVRAPFDGILDTRLVDEGAVLNMGDRLGTVVDLNPIKVTAQVSERNVAEAKVGMQAKIVLTDGAVIPAEVSYIASVSDPNTRTFTIEVTAPNPDGKVLAGLAAQLRLPFGQNTAHLIAPSVMTLSDEGKIGIKAVDDGSKVKFWPIEIVDDGPDGTWVSGLPDVVNLIIVGQEYVAVGQQVRPVSAADKTS
ncbi:MAG: efflux RND transporter periplasmic adaptor subunit [Alphaproteobacteria bacterium]|nr:efflux RND transporter periplasmic adaptor subunit [Alphaproteobacteria bacterium]